MLAVSDNAIAEFKKVLDSEDRRGMSIKIRAFVTQSSCCSCGPSQGYEMDLVEKGADGDVSIEKDGVRFFMDTESAGLMDGFEIDFAEEYGFIVKDTNAPSCGCGDGGDGGSCCG